MIIQSGITIGSNIRIGDLPTNPYLPPYLYQFSTFTFQTGNIVGPTGPTATQLFANSYTSNVGNTWITSSTNFNVVNGYQYWTVPQDGNYQIVAAGSRSGISTWTANATTTSTSANMYGRGATISGTFALTQGQIIAIAVGQPAANVTSGSYVGGGGGGGTFVVLGNTFPLVVAGAGGGNGGYSSTYYFAGNGNTSTTGGSSTNGGAPGGVNGLGGNSHINASGTTGVNLYDGGGGGGFLGNGASGASNAVRPGAVNTNSGTGGWGFTANLVGGQLASNFSTSASNGGFGGGGGGAAITGGGGGGYSGGGGAYNASNPLADSAGGGGSWVAANALAIATHTGTFNGSSTFGGLTVTTVGTLNAGPGYVTITRV
jgi:hypothetical protein